MRLHQENVNVRIHVRDVTNYHFRNKCIPHGRHSSNLDKKKVRPFGKQSNYIKTRAHTTEMKTIGCLCERSVFAHCTRAVEKLVRHELEHANELLRTSIDHTEIRSRNKSKQYFRNYRRNRTEVTCEIEPRNPQRKCYIGWLCATVGTEFKRIISIELLYNSLQIAWHRKCEMPSILYYNSFFVCRISSLQSHQLNISATNIFYSLEISSHLPYIFIQMCGEKICDM